MVDLSQRWPAFDSATDSLRWLKCAERRAPPLDVGRALWSDILATQCVGDGVAHHQHSVLETHPLRGTEGPLNQVLSTAVPGTPKGSLAFNRSVEI